MDSFTIELGVDPRQFTEGAREAMASFKKTQETGVAYAKDLEAHVGRLSDLFSVAKRGAIGLIGTFVGGEAAGFINNVATMDASVGRLATSLNRGVESLSKWDTMGRMLGGGAGEIGRTFAGISDTINNYMATTGVPPAGMISLLNRTGANMNDLKNPDSPAWDRISDFLVAENAKIPGMARTWAQMLGIDPNGPFFNALMLGSKGMRDLRSQAEQFGYATKLSAKDAQELQLETVALETAFEQLARETFPSLLFVATKLVEVVKLMREGWHDLKSGDFAAFGKWLGKLDEATDTHLPTPLGIDMSRARAEGALGGAIPIKPGAGVASAAMQEVAAALTGVGGIKQITSMADAYHAGFNSAHNAGRAMDVTVNDPSQASSVAAAIQHALTAKGIRASVTNEYTHPSAHATGGHLHIEVNPALGHGWLDTPLTATRPSKGFGDSFDERWGAGAGAAARGTINNSTQSSQHQSSNDISIGAVTIVTQAKDTDGIARDFAAGVRKNLGTAMPYNNSMTG